MRRAPAFRLFLIVTLLASLLTGCSRDPNVRKQKYFESGQRFFEKSKFREAAIQYSNAIQVDPRFADAHYRLALTYLRLGEVNRGFQELQRTVELQPDNYAARVDIANMLTAAKFFKEARWRTSRLVRAISPPPCRRCRKRSRSIPTAPRRS
jgi:Tfp pilus assembly protein PilF